MAAISSKQNNSMCYSELFFAIKFKDLYLYLKVFLVV